MFQQILRRLGLGKVEALIPPDEVIPPEEYDPPCSTEINHERDKPDELRRVTFEYDDRISYVEGLDAVRWSAWVNGAIFMDWNHGGGTGPELNFKEIKKITDHMLPNGFLPSRMEPTRETFEALGFRFGELHESDSRFTQTELPAGWKLADSSQYRSLLEHPAFIFDETGKARVVIWLETIGETVTILMSPVVRSIDAAVH